MGAPAHNPKPLPDGGYYPGWPWGNGVTGITNIAVKYGHTLPGRLLVLCGIPVDSETPWSSSEGSAGALTVYYRAGERPGAATCTLYVGSLAVQAEPTYSKTYAGATLAAQGRGSIQIPLDYPDASSVATLPVVLRCIVDDYVTLGAIVLDERQPTETP